MCYGGKILVFGPTGLSSNLGIHLSLCFLIHDMGEQSSTLLGELEIIDVKVQHIGIV